MSQITVQKLNSSSPGTQFLIQEIEQAHSAIEQRAFDLFIARGRSPGDPVQDWLSAERELFLIPGVEMNHRQDHFELHVVVEEIPPESLMISALPDSIIVQGEPDVDRKPLLRRICLPEEIDPKKVSATIDGCVLRIVAEKQATVSPTSNREPMETSVAA